MGDPVQRFLSGAYQFLDFAEQPKASNRGQVVEAFLQQCGLGGGYPWCMAAVSYIGYHAFLTVDPETLKRKSAWPLPLTAGCATMGDFAKRKGILVEAPQVGDVFLKYYPSLKRFAHTGIVVAPTAAGHWLTAEGNTNRNPEERDGWGFFAKHQRFGPNDRFVRWTDLLK